MPHRSEGIHITTQRSPAKIVWPDHIRVAVRVHKSFFESFIAQFGRSNEVRGREDFAGGANPIGHPNPENPLLCETGPMRASSMSRLVDTNEKVSEEFQITSQKTNIS